MIQRRTAKQAEPRTEDAPAPPTDAPSAGLQPQVQDHIGRQLRALYDDVLTQPVPDRFRELMDRLDRAGGEQS